MKKMLQFILLFLFISVIPMMVYADKVESDLVSTIDVVKKFEIGKVAVTNVGYTRYSDILSTGRAGVLINGNVVNEYVRDMELELTLNVYNKSKKIVEKRINVLKIPANSKITYKQYLYADELEVTLDDIAYYSFEADILSDVAILEEGQKDKYYLEKYNVVVNVSSNNVYNVTETFDAVFNNKVEPLKKGIPFRHKYVRSDGSKENRRAIISDIVIDDYYKLSTEEGIRYIKIGKEEKLKNTRSYNISYNYNVGHDTADDKDEFVYYLINNLSVKVDGVDFVVIMPEEFDEKNVRFIDSNGIPLEKVNYRVEENVITGRIDDVINPGTAYAISIDLKDGYFNNTSSNISKLSIICFIVPIIFVLLVICINILVMRKNKKTVYNSVYFNEKINSLELGYLYSGIVKDNDIASLIFCLANKGYIDIKKNKKEYIIIKKRDYKEDDRVEMTFMKELFFAKDQITKKELLSSLTDLKEAITIKLENNKKIKRKLFTRKIVNYKLLFWLMIAIIIILNVTNIYREYQPEAILLNCILTIVGYVVLLNSVLSKGKLFEKFLYTLVALIFIVSPIVITSYEAYLQDIVYTIVYIIGIVSMLVISIVSHMLSDRTKYGNKMLNKINAYKNYLVECNNGTVEKELRLNKTCLYEVLPYTLVLGISDRWIDKFRDKKLSKPSWYLIDGKFELDSFYLDVMNIYSDIFIALKNIEKDNEA